MREILFRGKTKSGMWVYGYYMLALIHGEKTLVIAPLTTHMYVTLDKERYIIDPETVGQFTGLTDKNGKKIFENDIIKDSETGEIFKIFYNWDRFSKTNDSHYFLDLSLRIYECEVIGNIYDNPELLK